MVIKTQLPESKPLTTGPHGTDLDRAVTEAHTQVRLAGGSDYIGGNAAMAVGFCVLESPTVGSFDPRVSPQLESYIKVAGAVFRESKRIDRPLGLEPDDYPVH